MKESFTSVMVGSLGFENSLEAVPLISLSLLLKNRMQMKQNPIIVCIDIFRPKQVLRSRQQNRFFSSNQDDDDDKTPNMLLYKHFVCTRNTMYNMQIQCIVLKPDARFALLSCSGIKRNCITKLTI